jgi:hypothetical protein
MKFTKKGIAAEFLVWTIIILLSGGVLLLSMPNLQKLFSTTVDKDACRTSVLLRGEAIEAGGQLLGGKVLIKDIPLRCKTEEIKITNPDPEIIKGEIANAMYSCWWQLAEGKKQFFAQDLTSETYCVICSTIEFDKNVQEKTPEITGLGQWFSDNYVPGKNLTYWQYFTNNPKAVFIPTSGLVNEKYPTNQKYAIVFSLWTKQYLTKLITSTTTCVGTGFAGAKLGALGGAWIGTLIPVPVVGTVIGTGVGIVLGGAGGCAIGLFTGGAIQDAWDSLIGYGATYYTSMQGVPYNAQSLKNMNCTTLQSIPS